MQDNKLMQQSFCFISDDLTHDTVFVHGLLRKHSTLIPDLSRTIAKVKYFSDGSKWYYVGKQILQLYYTSNSGKCLTILILITAHA